MGVIMLLWPQRIWRSEDMCAGESYGPFKARMPGVFAGIWEKQGR